MSSPDVVVAIFHEQEKILLQYRINTKQWPLHWGLPSGTVEPGESGNVAIRREMMEELGVTLNPTFEPEISCTSDGGKRFDAYVVHGYSGKMTNREPLFCGEIEWFDLNQLPQPLTSATVEILRLFRDST